MRPAFSTMDISSFAIKPMMTVSRMYGVPRDRSRRWATSTNRSAIHFLHKPLKPALDSSVPDSVFALLWNIPATARPERKSMAIKSIKVPIPLSHPPNNDTIKLPATPADVHNIFFILTFLTLSIFFSDDLLKLICIDPASDGVPHHSL